MTPKPKSSGRYFTISPKGGHNSKSGTFVERVPGNGQFVVKSMDGKVFDGARSAANTKLREVSSKFLGDGARKK